MWGLCGGTGNTLVNRLTGDVGGFPIHFAVETIFMNNQCLQHGYNTHLQFPLAPQFPSQPKIWRARINMVVNIGQRALF